MRETIFTEEEAFKKACCGHGNRPAENGPCIGSSCMAWEWVIEAALPVGEKNVYDITPRSMIRPAKVYRGYCGLSTGDKR